MPGSESRRRHGCDITMRDADHKIINEYSQCGELSALDPNQRKALLLDAARSGDFEEVWKLLMLGTLLDGDASINKPTLCLTSLEGRDEVTQLILEQIILMSSLILRRHIL